ncbi:uncharacterized protein LOC111368991 [Olea europaea var. sylvestris]|uniref:uncharacterized protein LOC111368991 n=1 Tax=Olea europaea var. sylvestris TaxID=158386 RepID=UPI000C1CDFE5|nr:uncharacterized protein LOC111368991 [Olea europaea var. sylvestris]
MKAFFKSMDERVWQSIVNGWSVPNTTVDGVFTPTLVENWSRAQLDRCNFNNKAIHALFMAVPLRNLREYLCVRFKEIRMRDDDTFDVFYASLNDIVNSSLNLGEKIPEPKIVRKILRSLPKRFKPKVTAIKEMAYLTKKFRKIFRKKKKSQERQKGGPNESRKKSKFVRCHNYQGFGHVRNECPSAKKFEEKAVNITLTDDGSSSKNQSEKSTREESGKYVVFIARGKSGSDQRSERTEDLDSSEDSNDESGSVEDLEAAYDMMYEESLKILATNQAMSKKVKELKLEKEQLEARVSDLTSKNEMSFRRVSKLTIVNETLAIQVKHLKSELELSRSQLLAFSSSSERLDNILGMGKPAGDKGGLGFDLNVASTSQTTFVRATDQPNIVTNPIPNVVGTSGRRSTRHPRTRRPRNRNQRKHITGPRFIPTCFHYGELGHICPKYDHYLNNRKVLSLKKNKNQVSVDQIGFLTDQVNHLPQLVTQLSGNNSRSRQVWVKKSDLSNLVRDRVALKGKSAYIPT